MQLFMLFAIKILLPLLLYVVVGVLFYGTFIEMFWSYFGVVLLLKKLFMDLYYGVILLLLTYGVGYVFVFN